MESYQTASQSFNTSDVMVEPMKLAPNCHNQKVRIYGTESINKHSTEKVGIPERFIGFLNVFIHQANEIHNICIYHKQDVYAKLSLTSDPEAKIESKTVRSAGRNPVFNENLQLGVRTIDSSLKCEIWMRSAAPTHLGDQLLGVVLIPLSDIILANGKLEKEFSLSTNDLFHSAAGFVQLSISYLGSYPEVMAIAPPLDTIILDTTLPDSENDGSIASKFANVEFPDYNVINENKRMVSELFGIPCTELDSQTTASAVTAECCEGPTNEEAGIRLVESFSMDNSLVNKSSNGTPVSSVSVNGSPVSLSATSPSSSDPMQTTASALQKEKGAEIAEGEADSSIISGDDAMMQPLINLSIEPAQSVMPQDIVEKYMKAMQESLASMKLPMDIESSSSSSKKENDNSAAEKISPASMKTGPRVFYGSRAFF